MADQFIQFLDKIGKDPVVESAKKLYTSIFEHGFFKPLTVPDSIKQNAKMVQAPANIVATTSSVGPSETPDIAELQNTNHRCTRDPNETANEKWEVPKFKKQAVATSLPIKQMIERAQQHLPNPMVMGVPYSTQPMVTGYTINSNWTNKTKQGVFAGDAGGGGGGGGAGAGGK